MPHLTRAAFPGMFGVMGRRAGWSALAGLAMVLGATGPTRAHDAGPGGRITGDLSFADPAPAGISYEWTVRLHRRQKAELIHAVSAKSWSEPLNPEGLKGWTHTSSWIALDLEDAAAVTITVERQQGVVVTSDTGLPEVARFALVPAVSVYSGWDQTTEFEDHAFNNLGNFWSTIVYVGSASNPKAKPRVVYKARLPAGRHSIVIGGNPRSLGEPGAYPASTCDPVDPVCYDYTGVHGYKVTIKTK